MSEATKTAAPAACFCGEPSTGICRACFDRSRKLAPLCDRKLCIAGHIEREHPKPAKQPTGTNARRMRFWRRSVQRLAGPGVRDAMREDIRRRTRFGARAAFVMFGTGTLVGATAMAAIARHLLCR